MNEEWFLVHVDSLKGWSIDWVSWFIDNQSWFHLEVSIQFLVPNFNSLIDRVKINRANKKMVTKLGEEVWNIMSILVIAHLGIYKHQGMPSKPRGESISLKEKRELEKRGYDFHHC